MSRYRGKDYHGDSVGNLILNADEGERANRVNALGL